MKDEEFEAMMAKWKAWRERRDEIRTNPALATPEDVGRLFKEVEFLSSHLPVAAFTMDEPTTLGLESLHNEVVRSRHDLALLRARLEACCKFNVYTPIYEFLTDAEGIERKNLSPEICKALDELARSLGKEDHMVFFDILQAINRIDSWTLRRAEDLCVEIQKQARRLMGEKEE